tara:strand:- start:194 stop:442 length:249 start_codon:yes stop_codon:yes gene_type:complete
MIKVKSFGDLRREAEAIKVGDTVQVKTATKFGKPPGLVIGLRYDDDDEEPIFGPMLTVEWPDGSKESMYSVCYTVIHPAGDC